ncbi:metallophosphoesterase [Levilactobacillus hammesii]|uniref:Phosphohydrolase n=1 Tax=Levilactobacillus hammesii DSM 16381 TaxID=1423753 RepID=A0A0R1UQ26_9LACO|nr:metallophosphoesterase [Levilactobacillus hammesii]KRL95289.1 phosphohydrolase [Levilactobacillus hammesii DSM 16381]
MVKAALISDLHFDVNHQDVDQLLPQQAGYLMQQGVGLYLIAGDITNHFDQSLAYVERLQRLIAPAQVRFIAGNHDMLHDVTYAALESPLAPTYLHRGQLDVAGTNWRIIGNNGWYDYQFADNLVGRDFLTWKRAFWVDGTIEQPQSDLQRMNQVLATVTDQLEQAQAANKRVLFMTHFVPRRNYIRYTDDNRFWNMANAMLGSPRMGDLLERYHVDVVQFGHVHRHFAPQQFGTTMYYDQAVGYHTKRINEWSQTDYFTEWRQRLRLLELK